MAATEKLRQFPEPLQPRNGVITLFGYGITVRVDRGHLILQDGIGSARREARLPRVGHGLKRLVVIGSDGMASLAALRWLADQEAAFVLLERDGTVLATTGPVRPSDARLRRAQALALGNGVGLEISRRLIDAKLQGQERVVRERLNDPTAAQEIAAFREKLSAVDNVDAIRVLEAHAAGAYFSAWHDIPVLWPKQDLKRIPAHWRTAGSRRSPLTGGPRLAVTPVQAILNYSFALLESETRVCICALGLDPGLGLGLHRDAPSRDSLVFDVLEPVRADVESWVLNWIKREPLRKADFFETATGNCRLMSGLCAKLSQTAPVWGKLVAPWAEYVARSLWGRTSQSKASRSLATPLTQRHRREAKGQPSFPTINVPRPERLCRGCGTRIPSAKQFCATCAVTETRDNFDVGRKAAHTPEALAKRAETQRKQREAIRNWNPSQLPVWLTRGVYVKQVQPALARVKKKVIQDAIAVSEMHAHRIKGGTCVPHPRHWQALARLIEISARYSP